MVWYVLSIGIVNLSLGFAAAMAWNRFRDLLVEAEVFVGPAEQTETSGPDAKPAEVAVAKEDSEPALVVETPSEVTEELPDEWLDILDDAGETATFVEAAVQVFKLEIGRYRDELIAVETKVRECAESANSDTIIECLAELKTVIESYVERQTGALEHLSSKKDGLGDLSDMGSRLEDVLMDQSAQIETAVSNIGLLDFETDAAAGCRRLIMEISKLIDDAHNVRDGMQESLVAVMHIEGRIATIDKRLQVDALTGLVNRSGLEKIFDEWWQDDPYRLRTVSVSVIDIDKFRNINQKYGTPLGDKLLRAFAQLLDGAMRKDRNYDVAMRCAGQRFVIFSGDSGPRNALSAVERIRQTIECTIFEYHDDEIEVTFSAGVVEISQDDTSATLLDRAVKTMKSAKKAGRNCTYINERGDAEAVTPPQFKIRGHICRLHE